MKLKKNSMIKSNNKCLFINNNTSFLISFYINKYFNYLSIFKRNIIK